MNPLPWFRYYTETHTDIKFTRLARECRISKAEAIGTWSILLCLAAQLTGTNRQYVSDAKRIAQEAPDLIGRVRNGELTCRACGTGCRWW